MTADENAAFMGFVLQMAQHEVFTFIDSRTNEALHFDATLIRRAIEADPSLATPEAIQIEQRHIDHIRAANGVEVRKLARLAQRPDIIAQPVLLAHIDTDNYVIIDGNHRMMLIWGAGFDKCPGYIIPRSTWENYLIDLPRELADELVKNDDPLPG